jgi:hypothetical protein
MDMEIFNVPTARILDEGAGSSDNVLVAEMGRGGGGGIMTAHG